MTGEIDALIDELRSRDDVVVYRAHALLRSAATRDPARVLPKLCRAVAAAATEGHYPTLQLLMTVATMGTDEAACLETARDVLRGPADQVLSGVGLAAGALIARAEPQTLIPDPGALLSSPDRPDEIDVAIVRSVPLLLAASVRILESRDENDLVTMVRSLWHHCATYDLMALADVVACWIEMVNGEALGDVGVDLLVDLARQVSADGEAKRYVGQVLRDVGACSDALEQMFAIWRASAVSEGLGDGPSRPTAQSATGAMATDPLVDQLLVQFADGDRMTIEAGRHQLEALMRHRVTPELAYWIAATIDGLENRRRHAEVGWMLSRVAMSDATVPGPFLRRWLDAPLLLDVHETIMALIVLSRSEPAAVATDYVDRAISVSQVSSAEIRVWAGDLWRAIACADPMVVLKVACRWYTLGFGSSDFSDFIEDLIDDEASRDARLAAIMYRELQSMPDTPAGIAARIRPAAGKDQMP